nr:MAG TPA: IEC3 subunit of the Ino80 complex, chromatin re-modelling [Caudoviricetes sp.]
MQLQALNDSANMSKNRVAITNLTTSGFSLQNPQSVYNWIAVGI